MHLHSLTGCTIGQHLTHHTSFKRVGYLGGHVIRGILSRDLHYGFIRGISELSGPLSTPWSLFRVSTGVVAL